MGSRRTEGSFANRPLVRDGKVSLPGKVVTVARHFGSHLGEKASFAEASYDDGLPLCWSVEVREQGVVEAQEVNTALSGIEACCPSKAQYQSLTSLVTCLARRVMAGAAARRGEHGRVRTMTNKKRNCVSGNWRLVMWKSGCEDSNGHRLWCRTLRTTHN